MGALWIAEGCFIFIRSFVVVGRGHAFFFGGWLAHTLAVDDDRIVFVVVC